MYRRYPWVLLALLLTLSSGDPVSAQVLSERPQPSGGDPVGSWEADETPLKVYAAPELVTTFNPDLSGNVAGRLDLESGGTYTADYALTARVKITYLMLAIDTSFVQMYEESGTFDIQGSDLILTHPLPDGSSSISDTIGFTAGGDSLFLVERVPLGGFEALVTGLFPDAGPPLAVLGMGRVASGNDQPVELTADFDGNGSVDFGDFLSFARNYGSELGQPGFESGYDLTDDGKVGFLNFLELARQYGKGT